MTIDSSFFVALFLEKDVNNDKAQKLMRKINKDKVKYYVLPKVIEVTITALTYKHSSESSIAFIEYLNKKINSGIFILKESNFSDEINFYKKIMKKISFIDSSIIYFSLKNNIEIISYDKQLLKIYKSLR